MDGGEPRAEGLRAAATNIGAAELDAARFGFHNARPQHSAKRRLHATQALWIVGLCAAAGWCAWRAPGLAFGVLHAAALALFASAIAFRLFAAASLKRDLWRLAAPARWPVYTVLCPLYREARVTPDLVAALEQLDYPAEALDIKLLVEGDDVDTLAAALAMAGRPHIEVIIIPATVPRTKPKALNVGLARARGEYAVVYDAEDRPHPQQLRAALAAFEDGGARLACVQAPLAIDNPEASWVARQFAAEYAIQFGEVLPLLTRLGLPLPLGGTSNHFRVEALRAAGGWDAYNVTEDADLGYRFARDGWRVGMIGPPTWEEAPVTHSAWFKQRARWIKGHMQTWLVLMRSPFRVGREMGWRGFAAMQLMLGGGVAAAFAHGPLAFIVMVAALSHYNLAPVDFVLAVCGYCVAMFSALTACALSNTMSHARAALTMPLYWPLSTIAALRALFELAFRPHHWSKTEHGVSARRRYFVEAPAKRYDSDVTVLKRGHA